ncbi:hypothetical protein MtrunA17_Chr6g0467071 [Medicago truncatula]|uniref:Uncharacterized protein n=1 Tax=Medicago truncatula TaxID=3880 RepID=A0A396HFI6_MEDTR|nr:hypothetical protein MtrunA17_Chr6g0467071 [Medicago truncatula]
MSYIRELLDLPMACFCARKPHVVESTMSATSSQKIGSNFHSLHRYEPVIMSVTVYMKALFANPFILMMTNKIEGVRNGIHGFESLQMISVDLPL